MEDFFGAVIEAVFGEIIENERFPKSFRCAVVSIIITLLSCIFFLLIISPDTDTEIKAILITALVFIIGGGIILITKIIKK